MGRPLIVDANSLIVRNIMSSALSDLQANGKFTGGIYGSLQSLRLLVSMPDAPVDRVYAFFDHGVPPRRRALIPEYKSARASRREMLTEEQREQAFAQIGECFNLFRLLGVHCMSFVNREADDCVAAAARAFAEDDPIVASTDADLLQTVLYGASVFDFGQKRWVTTDTFEETVGVAPPLYVLLRTLVGDTSDSIKGAAGCGPVRAKKLLAEFDVYDDFPPHVRDLAPLEQFDALCSYLLRLQKEGTKKLAAWEQAIVDDRPRLRRVIQAINLDGSFGPSAGLQNRLGEIPPVQPLPFLKACKALSMKSILGEPETYLRPFRTVEARRIGKGAKSTV